MTDDWKRMAGTEGTGAYVVIAQNQRGDRIGIRPLGDGMCRIRVEPIDSVSAEDLQDSLSADKGWNQPAGNQLRFSRVACGDTGEQAVLEALTTLGAVGDRQLERNRTQTAWQWRAMFVA